MRIKVSAQVPAAAFTSLWDDPTEASQEFVRFAEDLWRGDLQPLEAAGIEVSIQVGVTHPDNPPQYGVEIGLDAYRPDMYDMMKRTRELLTTQAAVWEKWLDSPTARALYRG